MQKTICVEYHQKYFPIRNAFWLNDDSLIIRVTGKDTYINYRILTDIKPFYQNYIYNFINGEIVKKSVQISESNNQRINIPPYYSEAVEISQNY